jgi:outer membrane biosynthesis protein TonB
MTAADLVSFLRTRKGTALSVALHVLVIGWGLFSFSSRSLEAPAEDVVAVDIVADDNVAKAKLGIKSGKKENPKPLVEKVAEAKPVDDDPVGKISEKQPVLADTAPPPTPKPEEKPIEKKPDPPKPVEKKPDPPKPVAEAKPKDAPKPDEKKPEEKKPDQPKADPIAEALKKEEKKPPPKPQAAAQPAPPKPKADRVFDQSRIAALLDKRDPSRQAVTGAELNANAALGTAHGKAADNSATWISAFVAQVESCWKKPYGAIDQQKPNVSFEIHLKRDGTLESMPVAQGVPTTPYLRAYQESALRAIIACQPYRLPAAMFDDWKWFIPVFMDRDA